MKLISIENYELKVAEEALLVKPIRRLWNMDRTQGKEQFYRQMSVLFFVYSPASNYTYITDEDERMKEVLAQEGLSDFKPTPEFKAAVEVYRKLNYTPESMLLQSTYNFLEKTRKQLDEITYEGLDAKDMVNVMKTGVGIVTLIPKLMKELSAAKNAVEKELEENSNARGAQELTVGDIWAEQGM